VAEREKSKQMDDDIFFTAIFSRAGSGSGFYLINQKPEPAAAWILGKARRPDFFAYLVKSQA
jgi:hypothetical protein